MFHFKNRRPVLFNRRLLLTILQLRYSLQQSLCVGMSRMIQHLFPRAIFHNPTFIHDRDLIGQLRRDPHTVGDQQNRSPILLTDLQQLLRNLQLHRYIQRTGRLICQQKRRIQHHRQRNRHPLVHPSGELKRTAVQNTLRILKLHAFQNRRRPFLRLCPGDTSVVCMQCIVKLPSDFTDRIQ